MTLPTPKPDILIVTVTDIEQDAVYRHFKAHTGKGDVQNGTYIDLGMIEKASVWMVISGMGSEGTTGSVFTIQKAINETSPQAVIMVGIAFGVDETKQQIGDILVSEMIVPYENQRLGNGATSLRGARPPATARLFQIFKTAAMEWREQGGAPVHFGPVLSGNKLVDNLRFRNRLIKMVPDAIGGEMEGAGLCFVAYERKKDWILIKSICDWADGNKSQNKKERQALAADNAALFTLHVLKKGLIQSSHDHPIEDLKQDVIQVEAKLEPANLESIIDKIRTDLISTNYSHAVANAKRTVTDYIGKIIEHEDPVIELLLCKFWTYYALALIYTEGIDNAFPLLNRIIDRLEKRQAQYKQQTRLIRQDYHLVLGRAYNHLGYGHWMDKGHYEAALRELNKALSHFTEGKWEQETATAYDNLGRIYAQLGFRVHAEFLIEHGLKLRTKLNDEYRRALSLNSSAIVHLSYGQSLRALLECEEALKIFKACIKQNGLRGYGLALITKSRSLRMLGSHWRYDKDTKNSKSYLDKAESALMEAKEIFPKVDEDIRVLQVVKELGCVYREYYMLYTKAGIEEKARAAAMKAENFFKQVVSLPNATKFPVIYVDTCHDLSLTYYLQENYSEAENTVNIADKNIPRVYAENLRIFNLPVEQCIEDYWQELGKIYALKGDLEFQRISFPKGYQNDQPLDAEPEGINQKRLKAAFRHYILAAAYFGRFLARPISSENLIYPEDSQYLESHSRFTRNLYEQLSTLTKKDLSFLRSKVYEQTIRDYKLEAKWIERFFKQPFDLLLR